MRRRCERCEALIEMEESGYVFLGDPEIFEKIWWRDCPFCGRENKYYEQINR